VVSFTPRPLYPQEKSSWYPLDRRLGGLQNIKVDLKYTGCEGVDWIQLAQKSPVAGSYEHGNRPSNSMKGGEFLD
jgi:hypothetical protein